MKKETIEYDSPVDALVALSKRLNTHEAQYKMTSEDFYDRYTRGELGDERDYIIWANDYEHYLVLKQQIEEHLTDVA